EERGTTAVLLAPARQHLAVDGDLAVERVDPLDVDTPRPLVDRVELALAVGAHQRRVYAAPDEVAGTGVHLVAGDAVLVDQRAGADEERLLCVLGAVHVGDGVRVRRAWRALVELPGAGSQLLLGWRGPFRTRAPRAIADRVAVDGDRLAVQDD